MKMPTKTSPSKTSSSSVGAKKGHPVGHLPKTVHTSKLNKGGDLAFKGAK